MSPLPTTATEPAAGSLRIWKSAGMRNANSLTGGGDYIPATVYTAVQLGFSESVRTRTFYVEAVRASSSMGDLRITAQVDPNDPDYQTAGVDIKDAVRLSAIDAEFTPDYNRDGVIDDQDKGKVTAAKPWRFWVNNDNDVAAGADGIGKTEYDITGSGIDGMDAKVDGIRDLIDFFPLAIDMHSAISILPPGGGYTYALGSTSGTLHYFAGVKDGTPLALNQVKLLIEDPTTAQALAHQAIIQLNGSVPISPILMAQMATGPGLIFVEASSAVAKDAVTLQVLKGQTPVATFSFPVSTSNVEAMFMQKNFRAEAGGTGGEDRLTAPNRPFCMDQTAKTMLWLHGYNVSASNAAGTFAEVFKRFFHSGYNGGFIGVSWFGNPPAPGSPHYHEAVVNAFYTGELLATFVNNLAASGQQVSIGAHSLGNMVVGEAIQNHSLNFSKYFAVDAAVALEAYGQTAVTDSMIEFSNADGDNWQNYYHGPGNTKQALASEWHTLFPGSDARSTLTWRNRLGNVAPTGKVYNFYSSTEDVLREYNDSNLLWDGSPTDLGDYAFVKQEKFKGRRTFVNLLDNIGGVSSPFCGWGYNPIELEEIANSDQNAIRSYRRKTVAEVTAIISQFPTNPLFELGPGLDNLVGNYTNDFLDQMVAGSPLASYYQHNKKAQEHVSVRDWLLAEAFPATTLPMGANKIAIITDPNKNIDMSASMKTSEGSWPRLDTFITGVGDWRHGDYKDVPYQHTFKFYKKIKELM